MFKALVDRIVMNAICHILASACNSTLALGQATRMSIRLYVLEGSHLSRKVDRHELRMAWYSDPSTARSIVDGIGNATGRMVYIDMTLDATSDYNYRFYKKDDAAYILRGDLIKVAKQNWKYVKEVI